MHGHKDELAQSKHLLLNPIKQERYHAKFQECRPKKVWNGECLILWKHGQGQVVSLLRTVSVLMLCTPVFIFTSGSSNFAHLQLITLKVWHSLPCDRIQQIYKLYKVWLAMTRCITWLYRCSSLPGRLCSEARHTIESKVCDHHSTIHL